MYMDFNGDQKCFRNWQEPHTAPCQRFAAGTPKPVENCGVYYRRLRAMRLYSKKLYVCVYAYIHIYICMYIVHICIYKDMCIYLYHVYMGLHVYMFVSICVYVYARIYIYIYVCVYVFVLQTASGPEQAQTSEQVLRAELRRPSLSLALGREVHAYAGVNISGKPTGHASIQGLQWGP